MKRLIYWLAAALLVSGVYYTIYAAVQHSLRVGANDPPPMPSGIRSM